MRRWCRSSPGTGERSSSWEPRPGSPDLAGREVHLVRDDGRFWFELRALAVRGVLRRADAGPVDQGLRWYVLDPGRTVAWDYGALREVPDA